MYCFQDTPENVFSLALKTVVWHLPFFFDNFGGFFALMRRTVAKKQVKTLLHWLWKQFYDIFSSFLSTLVVILCQMDVSLLKYGRMYCIAWFETCFTAFAVLFLALRWLFCVNPIYRCQDTHENVLSSTLKMVLRHLTFFFDHFGGYFSSIRRTVAKIQVKMLLRQLLKQFYGICSSFLSTLVVILRLLYVLLPKYRKKRYFCRLWNWFYGFCRFLFSTLVVILRQSDVQLPRYVRKRCFAAFETGFTTLSALFWALWWLFCVERTYHCSNMGESIASPAWKLVLWHLPFFSGHFGGCFVSIWCTVAKIRIKTFFVDFENGFTAFAVLFWLLCGYFASIRRIVSKIQAKMLLHQLWKWFYGICSSFLSTLVVILCLSDVPLLKYRKKSFFCWLWNRFYSILRTFLTTLVLNLL